MNLYNIQCLTVTEGINIKFNLLGFIIPTERFKSIILTFLYNPTHTTNTCIESNRHPLHYVPHALELMNQPTTTFLNAECMSMRDISYEENWGGRLHPSKNY